MVQSALVFSLGSDAFKGFILFFFSFQFFKCACGHLTDSCGINKSSAGFSLMIPILHFTDKAAVISLLSNGREIRLFFPCCLRSPAPTLALVPDCLRRDSYKCFVCCLCGTSWELLVLF